MAKRGKAPGPGGKAGGRGKACRGGCGCGAVGPGGRALGVDPGIKEGNLTHLRRIEGQVRGVAAMVEGDRYCADIITQISAIRESLHAVARNLMRNHLHHCAAAALSGEARDEMVEELLRLTSRLSR